SVRTRQVRIGGDTGDVNFVRADNSHWRRSVFGVFIQGYRCAIFGKAAAHFFKRGQLQERNEQRESMRMKYRSLQDHGRGQRQSTAGKRSHLATDQAFRSARTFCIRQDIKSELTVKQSMLHLLKIK